jgi:hypothetical protein
MPDDVVILSKKGEEEDDLEFWSAGAANKKKGKKPKAPAAPPADAPTVVEQHRGNLKITTITK